MKKLSNFLNKALMSAQSSTMLPQIFPSTMAVTIPVIAAILQQEIWPYIPLWPWLLLYLAVLFNVWIGGLWGGIASTAIATLLVLYFFVPPDASREVQNLEYNYAIAVFAVTGLLITVMHEKLNRNHMALQKANDSLIKTNQDRLTFALASTQASLWEWDVQNNKLFLSDNFCSMCGFDPARSLSYDAWLASIHTADQASVVDTLNRSVMAGLDINLEWRVANLPAHHERWLMMRGEPVFDGTGKAILNRGIVQDITQRKRQEQIMEEHRQRLDFVLSALEAGAWELDLQNHSVQRTLFHDQIFGYQELLPEWTLETFIEHVLPEDRDIVSQRFNAAVQAHSDWDFECRIRRGNDEIRWIYAKGRIKEKDLQGQPLSMTGVIRDITDQKHAETMLKEVAERKDELLAMLAHELRNPLVPIRNAAQILKRPNLDEARLAWCRDVIDRQVDQLVRLVDDLLDISRIDRGKIELKKEPLEISTFVHRAVETSQPLIEARRHAFSVHLPPEPVYVEGDLVRLSQVVSNLLNNAAKYTDEGGCITLSVEPADHDVFIRVRDNGRGIDPAALSSLFELFYQLDRTLDRTEGGLGIGLSLVKNLVTMHGGEVWAYSEGHGKGSEFIIRLPCLREAPAAPAPVACQADPKPDEGPLRILVADDNRDAVQSLSLLLTSDGYEVSQAYDGYTALETAQAERPQVVLLDIGLPGMDGYAVARSLRQHPVLKTTHLIALSGYGREVNREQARTAGFNHYLTKPAAFDELKKILAQIPFFQSGNGLGRISNNQI